ncbi:hypothetical protein D3P07_04475 [Paenibacillus sp. 1011MAR3C5]|nr:hypothetical protein D3P07_04475 [Paenibacillus sp. 1011MAR3C5]
MALVDEFIKLAPEARPLLDAVAESLNRYGKKLMFEVSSTMQVTFTAFTQEYKKDITVTLKPQIAKDEMKSVFIHELGEVSYIACSLPDVIDHNDYEGVRGRLIELFSHPHVLSLAQRHGLGDIELEMRKRRGQSWKDKDYIAEYHYGWHITLMIAWAFITFPELIKEKENIIGYHEHRSTIDQIVAICQATDTMSDKTIVESAMTKVITILNGIGLSNVVMEPR